MSKAFGQWGEHQIANHQTSERRRKYRSQHLPGQIPFTGYIRRHVTNGLGIEPIEEHDKTAQNDDHVLKRTHGSFIHELRKL
ncbi:hypothetical protein D3C71_1547330 [compost metagenome]